MSLKITNKIFGRKRFLALKAPPDIYEWQSDLIDMKNFLARESRLQMVGNKVYFEMGERGEVDFMMIEVVGQPTPLDQKALVLMDRESCDVLVYKMAETIFSIDFDQLKKSALGLKRTLAASFWQEGEKLSEIFNIVFDYDKIELHFFRQKDYIQKQF